MAHIIMPLVMVAGPSGDGRAASPFLQLPFVLTGGVSRCISCNCWFVAGCEQKQPPHPEVRTRCCAARVFSRQVLVVNRSQQDATVISFIDERAVKTRRKSGRPVRAYPIAVVFLCPSWAFFSFLDAL